MNFKDAYKSYNDEIKGDPKVLDTILNGKKESKNVIFMRPSLVGAMAAVVVIAVSVFGFNGINNNSDSPKRTYIAARNTNDNNTQDIPESFIVPDNTQKKQDNNDVTIQSQNPENEKNYTNKRIETKKKEPASSEPIKKVENPIDNNVSELIENTDVYRTVPATEDTVQGNEAQIASHENEVYSGIEYDSGENTDYLPAAIDETVTTVECYDYFGFDVTQKASLPQDMSFGGNVIIDARKSAETGEMEYCSFSIDAYSNEDPQRSLDVCVTKQNTSITETPSEQYYTSSETGEVTGGKTVSENMSVEVKSQNVTQTEVEELIESLN